MSGLKVGKLACPVGARQQTPLRTNATTEANGERKKRFSI
jgi:hypothetical protein